MNLRRFIPTCVVMVSLTFLPLAQNAQTPILPDTPVGKKLLAYIDAFNSGKSSVIAEFWANYDARPDRNELPTDEASSKYQEMYGELGDLKLYKIYLSKEFEINVLLKTKNGKWMSVWMAIDAKTPNKIIRFRGDLTQAPGDR